MRSNPFRDPRSRFSLAALLVLLSCRGDSRQAPQSTGTATAAQPSAAAVRPRSPRLDDPRWRRAADDPLELRRLADDEGAAGLVEAIEDSGDIEATALRALPYAEDADAALGPLAARALAASPAAMPPLLQAILEIAGRPPPPREPFDPEGARAAADAVLTLARRGDLPSSTRALAISAARAFAARGIVEASAIPTDIDQ